MITNTTNYKNATATVASSITGTIAVAADLSGKVTRIWKPAFSWLRL